MEQQPKDTALVVKRTKILGLPKNIFLLGLTSFFNDFSSEMVFSVFPAFFTTVLKSGATSLGLVEGIADSVSNLFKIYSGNLSDRLQKRKPFVVAGYSMSVITRPFYIFVSSVGGVLGLRFMDRLGKGMRDAPRDAIISLSTPRSELGRSFGYHKSMDTMGAIFGPFVAFMILETFPMRFDYIFILAFFVGIFSVATLFFVVDIKNHISLSTKNMVAAYKGLPKRFKVFLLSVFVLSSGSIPIAVILLKVVHIGLAVSFVPLFYMVYNASFALTSPFAGRLSDKVGTKRTIWIGFLLLILSYLILGLANSVGTLIFGFFALGLFPAFTEGIQKAFASKITEENERGEAMGLINAANGFGALIAGIGGGYLWQNYGDNVAFGIASIVVLIGLGILLTMLVEDFLKKRAVVGNR